MVLESKIKTKSKSKTKTPVKNKISKKKIGLTLIGTGVQLFPIIFL